jgi:hypothetical protein
MPAIVKAEARFALTHFSFRVLAGLNEMTRLPKRNVVLTTAINYGWSFQAGLSRGYVQ